MVLMYITAEVKSYRKNSETGFCLWGDNALHKENKRGLGKRLAAQERIAHAHRVSPVTKKRDYHS